MNMLPVGHLCDPFCRYLQLSGVQKQEFKGLTVSPLQTLLEWYVLHLGLEKKYFETVEYQPSYHSVYKQKDSKLLVPNLSTLLKQLFLLNGPFWQSIMHSTIDFCPTPGRRQTYFHVQILQGSSENTVLLTISQNI